MTKKTDLESLLGGARGAQSVVRPQAEPVPAEAVEERRINVALRADLHKALKLWAVEDDSSVQDMIDRLVNQALQNRKNI